MQMHFDISAADIFENIVAKGEIFHNEPFPTMFLTTRIFPSQIKPVEAA